MAGRATPFATRGAASLVEIRLALDARDSRQRGAARESDDVGSRTESALRNGDDSPVLVSY